MNFLYVNFFNSELRDNWFIITDNWGDPILDIKEAKAFLNKQHPDKYWGIADREQMLLGNMMQDNV